MSELLTGLSETIHDLQPHQIHTFYESVGLMIAAEAEVTKRDEYLVRTGRGSLGAREGRGRAGDHAWHSRCGCESVGIMEVWGYREDLRLHGSPDLAPSLIPGSLSTPGCRPHGNCSGLRLNERFPQSTPNDVLFIYLSLWRPALSRLLHFLDPCSLSFLISPPPPSQMRLMGPPNATWQQILLQAAANPEVLKQPEVIKSIQV